MVDDGPAELASADGADRLLGACPVCRYVLRGLPVEHRCPECGLALDRRWQIHGGALLDARPRKGPRIRLLIPAFFFAYTSGWLIALAFLPVPRGNRLFLTIILGLAMAALAGVMLYRPRRFIALGPGGLIIHESRRRRAHYAWPEVGRARYDLLRKSVAFQHRGGEVRVKVFNFFGSDVNAVDECVRAINAYPRPK